MILVNKAFKNDKLAEQRKTLKRIAKIAREKFGEDIALSFTLDHPKMLWTDEGVRPNRYEYQVMMIWEVEINAIKLESVDLEECAIGWYFNK